VRPAAIDRARRIGVLSGGTVLPRFELPLRRLFAEPEEPS